jgi:hypothetical protein
MSVQQTIVLSKKQQLIPLNENGILFFKSTIQVVSNDPAKSFEGLVVSQSDLDQDHALHFEPSHNGKFSSIIHQVNPETSGYWYLSLRADEPVTVNVQIETVPEIVQTTTRSYYWVYVLLIVVLLLVLLGVWIWKSYHQDISFLPTFSLPISEPTVVAPTIEPIIPTEPTVSITDEIAKRVQELESSLE